MIKTGDLIGSRYLIVSSIGSGGMQDVFKAKDQTLNRMVALKTPQAGQIAKKFANSARIAALINNHNVAKTFDYFEEDGVAYLVEELVEGINLEESFQTYYVIDPHLGAHILHQLSLGIAASHHAGVIHRDMKPSNVLVSPDLDITFLKITDFGIATLTEELFEDAAKAGDLTKTTSGTIKGALPYMAPEMMFRKPGEHSGKEVDIWSIGAMMFRLLTGDYPFGVFLDAAVNVKTKQRAPWPGFMTASEQFRSLSVELQRIVERCLDYEPKNRPSADDLIRECQTLCYGRTQRRVGVVTDIFQGGNSGKIHTATGSVFFPMASVYGPLKPNLSTQRKVGFSSFPGTPHPRAHPVLVLR